MKDASPEILISRISPLLSLSTALIFLTASATPAAEGGAAPAKPAPQFQSIKSVTNLDWKVSAEFHDIDFDSIPLGEVVTDLQKLYKEQFDVLILNAGIESGTSPAVDPATGLPVPMEFLEARAIPVRMRLKSVTAPEVFQAMNTLFEIDRTPARWELGMNGNRPVAVLRPAEIQRPILPPTPPAPPVPPATGQFVFAQEQPVERMVLYVGELTGNPASGGMALDSVLKTVTATLEETFSPPRSKVQCHAAAELHIVTGPAEEVGFVREVLSALEKKVNADRQRKKGIAGGQPRSGSPAPVIQMATPWSSRLAA